MRQPLLVCGVLVPLVYAVADVVAGWAAPGYSFRDQAISELAAVGAASRPLFSVFLVVVYALMMAFGLGVAQAARGRRHLRVVAGLLIGFGFLALAVGQFVPMQPRGSDQGLTGALHLIEGAAAMLIVLTAMVLAAMALNRRFRFYTYVTIAVVLGFGTWSALDAPRVEAGLATPWLGVKERVFWYAYQLWFAVLAVTLLRERPLEGAD